MSTSNPLPVYGNITEVLSWVEEETRYAASFYGVSNSGAKRKMLFEWDGKEWELHKPVVHATNFYSGGGRYVEVEFADEDDTLLFMLFHDVSERKR